MPRLWLEYLQFLIGQRKITAVRHKFDEALRTLPITQHDRIWKIYIKWARLPYVPAETTIKVGASLPPLLPDRPPGSSSPRSTGAT